MFINKYTDNAVPLLKCNDLGRNNDLLSTINNYAFDGYEIELKQTNAKPSENKCEYNQMTKQILINPNHPINKHKKRKKESKINQQNMSILQKIIECWNDNK